jgi:predicted nucleic-acid-binding Zn-ribbon protein
MTHLLVKCKNCGFEFSAATQMNEEAFEAISIGNNNESCPACKRTLNTTNQIIISNRILRGFTIHEEF